jgi:uncharacterized protein
MIDPELLKILCCPETRQPLSIADAEVLERLNKSIDSGRLVNRAGRPIQERFDGGLVRQDGELFYPILQSIPILLVGEAIPLKGQGREHDTSIEK